MTFAGGVEGGWTDRFVQPPVSHRFSGKHGFGIGTERFKHRAAWFSGNLLQHAQESLNDSRFGLDFETGGAGRPGSVPAEFMLLRRGDVAFGSVGQFDIEGSFEGALGLELEAGYGEDLVGEGGDAEVADADGLKL